MSHGVVKSALCMFYEWEQQIPHKIFLRQPVAQVWREYSWQQVGQEARKMAQVLRDHGCETGDRVAILSKNCAHWIMADLAIMMAGCVSVPLYPTQTADSLSYILQHSGSKVVFVGKLDAWQSLASGLPHHLPTIGFPYPDAMPGKFAWTTLLSQVQGAETADLPLPEQLASIIYTSGTTGFPKGVMHSFASIAHATCGFQQVFGFSAQDRLFSYLPLSHVAERVLVEMMAIYCGSTIAFAESLEHFAENLRQVAPSAFFSVPRLWTKFQQGILAKIPQSRLDFLLSIPLLSRLVKYKIRKGLGLHKAHLIGSGAAPIAPALLAWYQKLGINILEGYGLTENFGYATANIKGKVKLGTVGQGVPNSFIVMAEDSEIWIRNRSTMLGYYRDPMATAEVLQDGMLKTGDIGRLDADGYLYITGRVKEIFKTDKGKYIAPAPIESIFLADNPNIEQLCVMGHTLAQPVALCILTQVACLKPEAQIHREFSESLRRLNKKLAKHEQVERCILIREEWTVHAGMMTPTLKIKRHHVEAKYREIIDKAAIRNETIVWEHALLPL